jgi:hypothetical protein
VPLKLVFSEIVFIGRLLCLVGIWLSGIDAGGKGGTLRGAYLRKG